VSSHIGVRELWRFYEPAHLKSRSSDTRFPDEVKNIVEDRCRKVQPCRELTPSGIGDRRIRDPEDVSSTHLSLAKSELPIGGKDRGLCGLAGHMRKS
jgi:hypothetical protein